MATKPVTPLLYVLVSFLGPDLTVHNVQHSYHFELTDQ